MPEYVSWWALADELGTKVYEAPSIEYMPLYLVHAAGVLSKARSLLRAMQKADADAQASLRNRH